MAAATIKPDQIQLNPLPNNDADINDKIGPDGSETLWKSVVLKFSGTNKTIEEMQADLTKYNKTRVKHLHEISIVGRKERLLDLSQNEEILSQVSQASSFAGTKSSLIGTLAQDIMGIIGPLKEGRTKPRGHWSLLALYKEQPETLDYEDE